MIEEAVVSRVLGAALQTGGDFAEVFVEDKRSSSGRLDDGKIEELGSGRDRGAGIRVVVGETTGFAHTADLSEPGLLAAAEAAAARRPGRWRRRPHRGADPGRQSRRSRWAPGPRRWPRPPRSSCCSGPTRWPAARAAPSSRSRRPTATAAAASWWPTPTACWPRTTRPAPCSWSAWWPSGDTGMQTGRRSIGHTMGFELFDRYQVEDLAREAAEQALTKLQARPGPERRPARGHRQGRRRRAVPRGVRPRPRGRPHPEERVGVRRPGRPAGGLAAGDHRRRRHHGQRVGHLRHRRRGHARPSATCSSRTASSPTTCGTSSGPARRAARCRATAAARATSTCRWSA